MSAGRWRALLLGGALLLACGRRDTLHPRNVEGAGPTSYDGGAADGQLLAVDGSCPRASGSFPDDGICVCSPSNYRLCRNRCFGEATPSSSAGCAGITQSYFCFDPVSDPDHCGTCGNVCADTATCRAGACGPASAHVVGPVANCDGLHIAVGAGMLFWSDSANGTVSRAPTSGGAAVTLAQDQNGPTLLALFGDTLYWIDGGAQSLMKIPAAGGTPTLVATSPNAGGAQDTHPGINGFTVGSDGTVYFSSGAHVYAVPPGGGAPVDVVDEARNGAPWDLAISGTTLAYVNALGGTIEATTVTPGQIAACGVEVNGNDAPVSCQIARTDGPLMDSIFIQNGQVYWADYVVEGGLSAPLSPAGPQSTSLFGAVNAVSAFTVVGDTAFLTTDSEVVAASLVADSAARPLARLVPAPRGLETTSIAADDAAVYWSTVVFDAEDTSPSTNTCFIDSVAR
ncbi:MAG TPA: hypothetical protein VH560_17615 [Polyangia bacterium]|jgi:hypothetical protein|nr:hypothetical protein [Polyangia bacterium]